MEMEFKDHSRRGRYIVILGVILALAAGGGAFYVINQAQQQHTSVDLPRSTVVVAAREIAARKAIEAGDLLVRSDVVSDASNGPAIVFTNVADVIGRVSPVSIPAGAMITRNLLASAVAGGQLSILGPGETISPTSPTWRAVSLTVPDDRAVGGQILAGQYVDIVVTVTVNVSPKSLTGSAYYTDKSTKVTYQDIQILAKAATLYIVKVDEATAEEMTHLQATGTAAFSMVLRPDGDTRTVDTSKLGETTNKIIERYQYPLPQMYPR